MNQIKSYFTALINAGIKDNYQPWEVYLTRKLNLISIIGMLNIFIASIFFYFFDAVYLVPDCLFIIIFGNGVILSNKYKGYVMASYWFYIMGYLFFISMNLKMGQNSYTMLFYFPMIISSIQLLGRKEMLKHLIFINIFCLLTVIMVSIGFNQNWLSGNFNDSVLLKLKTLNIILSVFTTIIFVIVVVIESAAKEQRIENMLHEKEVLIAEVFHRVKNNMNIVTSLLNLKKNMSDSTEVQTALEDCRNRVYSMALVHHKIYNSKNIVGLKFQEYIAELTNDVLHSMGDERNTILNINAEDIYLELSNAIPCGLILNELVTNSLKYAKSPDKKLQIDIELKKLDKEIIFTYSDNGPGLPDSAFSKANSLGIELIKSLSEQIDGTYEFKNENGSRFTLKFKAKEIKN